MAYYCFVNLGWAPHQFDDLSSREKALVAAMVRKEIKSRPKPEKG